ncbi:hypothetical protein D3C80_1609740 [compost metagenome]
MVDHLDDVLCGGGCRAERESNGNEGVFHFCLLGIGGPSGKDGVFQISLLAYISSTREQKNRASASTDRHPAPQWRQDSWQEIRGRLSVWLCGRWRRRWPQGRYWPTRRPHPPRPRPRPRHPCNSSRLPAMPTTCKACRPWARRPTGTSSPMPALSSPTTAWW